MPALYPGATTFPGANTFPGQPRSVWHVLRVSFDDVGTPFAERTWVALRADRILGSWEVEGGRDSELDEISATRALHVLDDSPSEPGAGDGRKLDPLNVASPYAPDVVPNRLLWHQVHAAGQIHDVFLGYVDGWGPDWNERIVGQQRARVRSTDGTKILTRFSFDAANPDVEDYDEVIQADDPWGYYRHGERQGTKLVSHSRVIRYKKGPKKGKRKRVKRWKTRATRAATTGVSGPSGTYRNTPALAQPGLIAGDPDTAVLFRASQSEQARIPVDAEDFRGLNGITVEALIKPTTVVFAEPQSLVLGPDDSAGSVIFSLNIFESRWRFYVREPGGIQFAVSGAEARAGVPTHVFGLWDGSDVIIDINGVVTTAAGPSSMANGASNFLRIGGALGSYVNGLIDEVAIYEKALSATRRQAHFDAGQLGFDAATTGERIGQALDLVGEFHAWDLQPGERTMPPARYAGREPAELIDEAADAEGLPSAVFFSKSGLPTYRDSNHRDAAPYTTPRYTFGRAADEIPFQTAQLSDQDSFLYNIIRGTAEGGEQTFSAEDAASIGQHGRSVLPLDSLPLDNDADVQAHIDALLDRYKDPFVRVRSFVLNGADDSALSALLDLELGDCVRVKITAPDQSAILLDQTSFVERRRIWQDSGPIMGEFSISPR